MNTNLFDNVFENFQELTANPETFVEKCADHTGSFKNIAKSLYDNIKQSNPELYSKNKSLRHLLLNNFDDEQIWGQLELQNKNVLPNFTTHAAKLDITALLGDTTSVAIAQEKTGIVPFYEKEYSGDSSQEETESNPIDEQEDLLNDSETSSNEYEDAPVENERDNDFDEEMLSEDSLIESPEKRKVTKNTKFKSQVDDKFFKLSKCEEFLKLEDLKEEHEIYNKKLSDDEEEEEEVDIFQDIPNQSCDLMYTDFFDAPESGDEDVKKRTNPATNEENEFDGDSNEFSENEVHEDNELSNTELSDKEENSSKPSPKTSFEVEQQKMRKQIENYEESMLKPAAWHLTGEVDATNRPTDALLHLQTDFEVNAKPVVIQDKALCEKLENMLKMTIKNKAYSDGVRQYKTSKEVITHRKEVVLEQTKSKKSLAQEYEAMYLHKQNPQEEEENPKHVEIKKFMDSLFPELYALFSHIPKPAIPDIKIVSNLPAVTVEEVAPTSVSDVTLLAPEEIKRRTGLMKGDSERDKSDKNRERRKKKLHQKMQKKKREEKEASEPSARTKKREKLDLMRKLKQQRNTKIASGAEKIKSSKHFFERLQETVNIKGKTDSHLKKKKKST